MASNPIAFQASNRLLSQFAALYALWVITALVWVAHLLTYRTRFVGRYEANPDGDDVRRGDYGYRIKNASKIGRTLVLYLTMALLINSVAIGALKSVEVLAWIYVAVAFIWMAFESIMQSRVARFTFGFIEYALILTIGALAFSKGWPFR